MKPVSSAGTRQKAHIHVQARPARLDWRHPCRQTVPAKLTGFILLSTIAPIFKIKKVRLL
jgi:hypothetical protein